MTIQHKIISFDRYLKKHCNIYGRSKLRLINRHKKPYHARFIYLSLLRLESTRDHSNSGVIYRQFHHVFCFTLQIQDIVSF